MGQFLQDHGGGEFPAGTVRLQGLRGDEQDAQFGGDSGPRRIRGRRRAARPARRIVVVDEGDPAAAGDRARWAGPGSADGRSTVQHEHMSYRRGRDSATFRQMSGIAAERKDSLRRRIRRAGRG